MMIEAEGIRRGGVGEAVVGGGWRGEAVDFDADEGKGRPAREGPGAAMAGFSCGRGLSSIGERPTFRKWKQG